MAEPNEPKKPLDLYLTDLADWLAWAERERRRRPIDMRPAMIHALCLEVGRLRRLLAKARGETIP